MLDLRAGRALHVGDQRVQRAVRVARQPQDVHLAAQGPARERHLQPGLEEDHRLAGGEGARGDEHLVVLGEPGPAASPLGREVADRVGRVGADIALDARLEGGTRAGEEGRDRLGRDVELGPELAPGPIVQAQAQVALALFQADELRDVGRREGLCSRRIGPSLSLHGSPPRVARRRRGPRRRSRRAAPAGPAPSRRARSGRPSGAVRA